VLNDEENRFFNKILKNIKKASGSSPEALGYLYSIRDMAYHNIETTGIIFV